MGTKLKPWIKWGCVTPISVVAALILGGYAWYRIQESPRNVLKQVLHLRTLPASTKGLLMGSDVWTDEVRSFYFEIAPQEFPLLLVGRHFELRDMGAAYEAQTIHVKPPVTFTARWRYQWTTTGANCTIDASESKERVVVLFTAE